MCSTACITSPGDPSDQAGHVHAVLRAGPERAGVDGAGGTDMTKLDTRAKVRVLRQVPRHLCQQRRPDAEGRIQVIVPDVTFRCADVVGHAVLPGQPASRTASSPCRRSGRVSGWSSSRATPITRSGWVATTPRPTCRHRRPAVPPGLSGFTFQTTLQNSITISDTPGPTGGILIKTTTGAMTRGQRHRHHHQQRQGRDHPHERAHRDINAGL